MEKPKPKKWMRYLIYAALAFPTVVLFLNENGEYEVGGIGVNSLMIAILAVVAVYLFYENFIDKALVKTKPANIGPNTPMEGQEEYSKPYSPHRDYGGRPPFS